MRRRASLIFIIFITHSLLGCKEQLIHNLSEQQANRLLTRLHDSKIDSQKKRQADGRWSVEVEKEQLAESLREMQKLRLIKDDSGVVHESTSVVSTRDQQRFAFERSLSAEIEQTLSSIEGVLEARVHLNLPQVDPLFGKITQGSVGSGSVFIIAEMTMVFSRDEIASLVAGAVGIPASGISVLVEIDKEADTGKEIEQPLPLPEPGIAVNRLREAIAVGTDKGVPLALGIILILIGGFALKRAIIPQAKKNVPVALS